jgi:integrase
VIPTTDWVFQQLQEWKQVAPYSPYGLVWPAADGRYQTDTQDRDIWKDICVQADVWVTSPDGTTRRPDLYEARHTAATLLLTAGVDETTIKAILGHSTVLSTKAYLHADQARVKAALNKSAQQLQLEPSAAIP